MPKERKKKRHTGVTDKQARISFKQVPSPELVQIEDLDSIGDPSQYKGKFVKIAPQLPRSAKDTFNGADIARRIRQAGALSVQLLPSWYPDSATPQVRDKTFKRVDQRQAVSDWFVSETVASEEDKKEAESLVLKFMEQEHL